MKRLKNINPLSKLWRLALASLLLTSVSAFGQFEGEAVGDEDDDGLEEVQGFTVVGSNIQRLDVETVSPVINITRESLDATGFSTAGDAIRALPIVSGQSLVSTDAGTSFTPGVSSVNLRGLGNNNTLALLNGRRIVPFASPGFNGFQTVVNINSIPSAAIESIQILKDGASAIYGSDAVAGVLAVNLTKEYDGLTTEVSIGNTLDTDSFEWELFAIGGATSGRASIVYTVNYRERNPLFSREIDWVKNADGSSVGAFDQRSSANISANVRSLDPTAYLIDPDGDAEDPANQRFPSGRASLAGLPLANAFGALAGPDTTFGVADFEDGNKFYNYQEVTGFFPEERNYGFYTRLSYAISDTLDAYLETSFNRVESLIEAAPTPLFNFTNVGDGPGGIVVMPATNPYNPFGVDLTDFRWRMIEVGNRQNDIQNDTGRIVAGLSGDLPIDTWTFDSGILFTEGEITNLNGRTVYDNRTQEALNGVTIDGELFYANPFGRNHPEVLDYISGNNPTVDSFELWSWDFKAQGDVVDLGDLGVVKAAVGAEYRFEELRSVRTNDNVSGNIVGGAESSSVFGDRNIKSIFAELSVPLTEMAEVQIAGRYEDYSDFGDTSKPKIGFKVQPVDGLLLRAAWGQSFRAPDLPFLFSSGSVSFTANQINDPLREDDDDQQIKTLGGGNPNLTPEETDSFYLGAVVDFGQFADAIDGLVLEVDLWRFEQDNVISRLGAQQIVTNAGDPFWDQFITRLPPGPGESVGVIQSVSTSWQNLDKQETAGVDVAISYTMNTDDMGEFRFKVETTYVDTFEFIDSFGTVNEFAGTWTQPKWRGNGTVAWTYGDWAASLFISYIGEYDRLFIPSDTVKAYWRFNPQVAFSGLYDTTITLGVRNVFNEEPPVDHAEATTRNAGVHNLEPRFFYMRVQKDW